MELARNGANDELICAGLLHDTIEDGGVSPDGLKQAVETVFNKRRRKTMPVNI